MTGLITGGSNVEPVSGMSIPRTKERMRKMTEGKTWFDRGWYSESYMERAEFNIDPRTVEIVWEDNPGGGWDWEVAAIVRRKIGDDYEWAVYEDSGCSCNGPYEQTPDYYDLSWEKDPRVVLKGAVKGKTVEELYSATKAVRKAIRGE